MSYFQDKRKKLEEIILIILIANKYHNRCPFFDWNIVKCIKLRNHYLYYSSSMYRFLMCQLKKFKLWVCTYIYLIENFTSIRTDK